jgi:SAM-dependent methyltransferase
MEKALQSKILMNFFFLNKLRCPKSGDKLNLVNSKKNKNFQEQISFLVSENKKFKYPIINNIVRFVASDNYAENFGLQWNYFSKSQLDSFSGHPISYNRFWKSTGWHLDELKDKWVLDVGCGSGRFAEIALKAGAKVVALDYSSSVDACYKNLNHFDNFFVVQADIYALPFAKASFDFVYSLGVLQHTPNVENAFKSLPAVLKNKGKICVDFYWKRLRTILNIKYLLRPITKKIDKEKLFYFVKKYAPVFLKISIFLQKIPLFGFILKKFIPVANYKNIYPLNDQQLIEWAILDTYDMFSPQYDNPQNEKVIKKWMQEMNFDKIETLHSTLLVVRGIKKT